MGGMNFWSEPVDKTFGQSMRRCPCDDFLCGIDYLRVILTPDLPLR